MVKNNYPNVVILMFPWASKAPYIFVSDIIKILDPITNNVFIITGHKERIEVQTEKVKIVDIKLTLHYAKTKSPLIFSYLLWIFKSILIQIYMTFRLIMLFRKVEIIIHMEYPYHLLPAVVARILRKKNIEIVIRSEEKMSNNFIKSYLDFSNNLGFKLMDGISPESKTIIKEMNLEKHKSKIVEECSRFVDFSQNEVVKLGERKNLIGFIGRLRKEKGITEFIKAIPLILEERNDIEFLIGGEGDMENWVKNEITKITENYGVKIEFIGWIPRKDIFKYLSSLKILVLPTVHAEGLPTIILESMVCGTPVFSTTAGAITDIVQKNRTGFVMENNSKETIANGILQILDYPYLDEVSLRARKLVEEKYSYEAAVERYLKILNLES